MMVARIQKKTSRKQIFMQKLPLFSSHSTRSTRWATREHPLHFCWWKFQLLSLLRVERDFEISVFNAFNLKSWFKLHLKWAAFLLLIRGKSVFPKSSALESWNWVFWSMSVAVFSFFSDEISEWFWDVKNNHHQFWTRSYENRSNWIIQALFDPSFLRHHIYLRIMRAYNVQLKQMSLFHRI